MILFISDLHLSFDKPKITRHFVHFLQTKARRAKAVYILGDLFDAWVGDDDFTAPNAQIRRELKRLTDSGVTVYIQRGNRDFLIGERFARGTGVILLDDYAVIDLEGEKTLLTHGDLLCSDDIDYQAFRAKSRTSEWQQNVLSKPLWLRLIAARWYRLRSFWHKQKKSNYVMDVNQTTVENLMRKYQCTRLIHGHTHRPALHEFNLNGKKAQRFVLSDWNNDGGEVLCFEDKK
ncbi:MAG: UDP-2,3-diacylglucosamine diphosphatase [Methylococcales bacterium]|nr:UDP-2,3-diacylglucosamine diphosphatase [Methylococcales bacterium]MDD5753956.1 UDP-2,3-diacylglucosamine diphosphatase [Methylococcales bacterium]